MDFGDTVLAISTGLGLSIACGFRVFTPMLGGSIAAKTGYLELTEGFTWLGDWPALLAFGVAAVTESIISKVPFIGNIMAKLQRPLVVVAGTVLSASSMVAGMDPLLQWSLAAIAGGGSAGLLHEGTIKLKTPLSSGETTDSLSEVVLETAVDTATEEMVNPFLSIAEDIGAVTVIILAIFLPVAVLFLFPVLVGGSVCVIKFVFAIRKRAVKFAINRLRSIREWIFKRRRASA